MIVYQCVCCVHAYTLRPEKTLRYVDRKFVYTFFFFNLKTNYLSEVCKTAVSDLT